MKYTVQQGLHVYALQTLDFSHILMEGYERQQNISKEDTVYLLTWYIYISIRKLEIFSLMLSYAMLALALAHISMLELFVSQFKT